MDTPNLRQQKGNVKETFYSDRLHSLTVNAIANPLIDERAEYEQHWVNSGLNI